MDTLIDFGDSQRNPLNSLSADKRIELTVTILKVLR
jgi:hypothetical protein